MITIKIGLPTRYLARSLRRAITTAAQLESDGVELDLRHEVSLSDLSQTGIRQLRKLLDDASLQVAAVRYPTRRGYDAAIDLERRLEGTCQAMQAAARLGARVVLGRACERIPAAEDPRREVLLQSLEFLAREGNRLGASFNVLTGDHQPEVLSSLLSQLPEGTISAALEPASAIAAGNEIDDLIDQLPSIGYLVAGDAVREFGSSRTEIVELGRGTVVWPELMACLEARGFQGWATVDHPGASDPQSVYGNAVAYLKSLTK